MRGKGRDQPKRRFVWTPDELLEFPSPCGEKVGINDSTWTGIQIPEGVSVPLRGKGRDQLERPAPVLLPKPEVSVPLRGKGRDQRSLRQASDCLKALFPSPCGEKVGINSVSSSVNKKSMSRVSVPLRGKGRDQLAVNTICVDLIPQFPSPCGEKVGINLHIVHCLNPTTNQSFRPLAGKR